MDQATDSSQSNMVASNQRPIPLKKRADLVVAEIDYLGVGYQVIKDPVALKYHRLQVEQYKILELLNGERSLEQIRDDLKEFFPTLQVTLGDIQQLITDLHKKCLVSSDRPGQGASVIRERRKERNQKIKQTLMSLMYLRLPGWDPERTLRWMYPYLAWLFWKPVVAMCVLFCSVAWLMLGANFEEFQSRLPEFQSFFGWPNLIYLWITLGAAKIIHEFGHGLSCHHYGGECHEMGVMLLVFSPCLYCDVTDSWMMKNKWHRIIIGAAGMYIEVIISAMAIFVWWFTKPGMLHYLALNTFFVTTITTVIFNANPLMRFDGYYMMSDFLEIPNLRAKSDKMLREAFSWYCLGIESRPDPFMPETGKGWFVAYAIAAWCYRWVILVSISLFLYTVLKPYDLQSLGVTLCIFSMAGIIFSMFRNIYQIVATPRQEPMSKIKIFISLSALAGVLYLIGTFPIRWYQHAPFYMEPVDVAHVTTPGFPGQLMTPEDYAAFYEETAAYEEAAISQVDWDWAEPNLKLTRFDIMSILPSPSEFRELPRAGAQVNKGDIIGIVRDAELISLQDQVAERLQQWRTQGAVLQKHYDRTREADSTDMSGEIHDTRVQMTKLQLEAQKLVQQMTVRVIRAPVSGKIIAPDRVPEPSRDEVNRTRLGRWHGTPLDPENDGCFVDAGSELMKIAPTDQFRAVLFIDQSDLEDFPDNAQVEMKLDHLPHISYVAPMTVLSRKGEKIAPESLTTKYGGPLATRPDDKGQETLTSTAYRATVDMYFVHPESQKDAELMLAGLRGNARVLIDDRTVYQWVARYIAETFRFRL